MKDPGHAAQKPALRFLTNKMGTIISGTRSCAEDKHVILQRTDILSGVQGMTKKIQSVISNFSFIQYKSKGAGLWSTSQRRGSGASCTADGESKPYLHIQSWVWLVGKKIWVSAQSPGLSCMKHSGDLQLLLSAKNAFQSLGPWVNKMCVLKVHLLVAVAPTFVQQHSSRKQL